MAERVRFELTGRGCRPLAFEASAFNLSAISPRRILDSDLVSMNLSLSFSLALKKSFQYLSTLFCHHALYNFRAVVKSIIGGKVYYASACAPFGVFCTKN